MSKGLMRLAVLAGMTLAAQGALAQDKGLEVQLNAAKPVEGGCALIFVLDNQTGGDFDSFGLDVSVYGPTKTVDGFYRMNFSEIPGGGKTTVQFKLDGLDCTKVSQVGVNAGPLADCTAKEGSSAKICNTTPSLVAGPGLGVPFP